jgi:hypothetical protein
MANNLSGKTFLAILILILLIVPITGCLWNSEDDGKDDQKKDNDTETSEFEQKISEINTNTLAWLETLDVNPIELRNEMGIKGKKKFVELLDSYLVLYQTTDNNANKTEYKNTVEVLIQVTYNASYHDMNEINDTQFRQDSTSYLRAWYIMKQFGLNTSFYEYEIEKVIPRIDLHLPSRGINQRMAFVFYYEQLGYPIFYTIEELFNQSVIRERENIENLTELDMYYITHEIFMLYDDYKMELLFLEDIEYLTNILPQLVNKTITEKNVDLLAELIMIMTYLGFTELDEYKLAVDFLLNSQNSNGSFGDYEMAREYYDNLGISVDIQLYLHTTEVSLRALNEAVNVFDE